MAIQPFLFDTKKFRSNPCFRFYLFSDLFVVNTIGFSEIEEMNENLIESIIAALDPDLVPWNYIDLAFVTGLDGVEREVHGDELYSILNHPSLDKVALSVQVLMDRKKLKQDIVSAIADFWEEALNQDDEYNDDKQ